jgi:hypothetical protein
VAVRGLADPVRQARASGPCVRIAADRTGYREPGARERQEYRLSGPGRELIPILLAFMA